MARKATGTKEWRPRLKTWVGRVWIDGVRSKWHDLCTSDATVADQRLEQWLLTGEPPSQAGKETFAKAAERVLRKLEDRKGTPDRRHRIRAYALPVIGHIEIAELKAPHVHSVLVGMDAQRLKITERAVKVGAAQVADELGLLEVSVERWVRARDAGELRNFALDTVHHMRVDISRILGALVLEGAIQSNVAEGVELPDDVEYDDRPFVVLNDEEVRRFFKRGFEDELMMACLLSREFAGQRTSDLLGADWEHYDLVNWKANIRRPKTDDQGSQKYKKRRKRRVTLMYERVWLVIPEPVRAPLLAWREQQRDPKTGELPTKGPLFPAQRGPNAGKRKASRGNSWAVRLRKALWEEGIVRPLPGYETATGDDRRNFCALQVDTEQTRRAVFHSFRRASVTALRKAGVPLRLAMLITGHSSESTHMGYDAADDAIEIPAASLASQPGAAGGAPPPSPEPPGSAREQERENSLQAQKLSPLFTSAEAPAAQREGNPAGASATRPGTAMPAQGHCESLEGAAAPAQDAIRSRPAADPGNGAPMLAAAPEGPAGRLPSEVALVLAQLVAMLAQGGGGNSPSLGLNERFADLIDPRNPQGFQRRARVDSNHRPTAPEAAFALLRAQKLLEGDPAGPPDPSLSDPLLARDSGYCQPEPAAPPVAAADHPTARTSPDSGPAPATIPSQPQLVGDRDAKPAITAPPTFLESLRAAARAAIDDGNLAQLDSIRPALEAEERRVKALSAPVSLEVIRAKREAK